MIRGGISQVWRATRSRSTADRRARALSPQGPLGERGCSLEQGVTPKPGPCTANGPDAPQLRAPLADRRDWSAPGKEGERCPAFHSRRQVLDSRSCASRSTGSTSSPHTKLSAASGEARRHGAWHLQRPRSSQIVGIWTVSMPSNPVRTAWSRTRDRGGSA
jgi:hypothetical protein